MNNSIKYSASAALLSALALFWLKMCTGQGAQIEQTTDQHNYIDAPFANVNIAPTVFIVDASEGAELEYGTTKITIPECAFLDAKGNVVKGEVALSYREVNNPLSIMVSGVPMAMEDGGSDYLQSAGMMEMLARQEGNDLLVNPNCRIKVEMQSSIGDGDYNLYNLDEKNRKWVKKKDRLNVNPVIEEVAEVKAPIYKEPNYAALAEKAGILNPVKPVLKNKEKFQFKFKMDFSDNPEINIYNGVQWEFAGKKKKENPANNRWVMSAIWNEMEIVDKRSNGTYVLRLVAAGQEFKTTVKPVFDSMDMEYAEFVFNQKYEGYRKFVDKKKEEARVWRAKQAKLLAERTKKEKVNNVASTFSRNMEVLGFGWINCDRMFRDDVQRIIASFSYEDGSPLTVKRAFLMIESINSVLSYYEEGLNNFAFSSQRNNQIIVIDSAAKVFKIDASAFRNINSNTKEHTFKVSKGVNVNSMDDLTKLVATS